MTRGRALAVAIGLTSGVGTANACDAILENTLGNRCDEVVIEAVSRVQRPDEVVEAEPVVVWRIPTGTLLLVVAVGAVAAYRGRR